MERKKVASRESEHGGQKVVQRVVSEKVREWKEKVNWDSRGNKQSEKVEEESGVSRKKKWT